MKILGYTIFAKDFIPPIIDKVRNKAKSRITSRYHPFDSISNDLNVKWILDVGANNGLVTRAALKSFKECKVICFEPVKNTFNVLKENLEPYSDRVLLFNQALSDVNGQTEINITSFDGANSIEQQTLLHRKVTNVIELSNETIETVRLDDVATGFPTKWLDVVKIDVEGHELNVLKGGHIFFSSSVDTIIIEISFMRDKSITNQSIFEIFSVLHNYGFCLMNIVDLHYIDKHNTMLAQFDCVFRHKSRLVI